MPFNYSQTMYHRLQNLCQGSKSVNNYTKEFYQVISTIDVVEKEEQRVTRYIGGLRPSIQGALNFHTLWVVSKDFQRAMVVEKQ